MKLLGDSVPGLGRGLIQGLMLGLMLGLILGDTEGLELILGGFSGQGVPGSILSDTRGESGNILALLLWERIVSESE